MTTPKTRRQRGIDLLTVFLAFAVLVFTGLAVAEEQPEEATPSDELREALALDPEATPAPLPEAPAVSVPELDVKATPTEERAAYLRAKLDQIRSEQQKLEALQADIKTELAKLEQLRQEIDRRLGQEDEETVRKLDKLVTIYDKMTVEQVTAVLNEQPEPLRIKLLFHMKEKRVSEILGEMKADQAARISQLLLKKTTN